MRHVSGHGPHAGRGAHRPRPAGESPDLTGVRGLAQPHCHQQAVLGWDADRDLLTRAGARGDCRGRVLWIGGQLRCRTRPLRRSRWLSPRPPCSRPSDARRTTSYCSRTGSPAALNSSTWPARIVGTRPSCSPTILTGTARDRIRPAALPLRTARTRSPRSPPAHDGERSTSRSARRATAAARGHRGARARRRRARGYPPSIGTACAARSCGSLDAAAARRDGRPGRRSSPRASGPRSSSPQCRAIYTCADPSRDTVLYPSVSYPTYEMGATLAGLRRGALRAGSRTSTRPDAGRALALW